MRSHAARSAIVRATLRMRWYARAESASRAIARASRSSAAGSGTQCAATSAGDQPRVGLALAVALALTRALDARAHAPTIRSPASRDFRLGDGDVVRPRAAAAKGRRSARATRAARRERRWRGRCGRAAVRTRASDSARRWSGVQRQRPLAWPQPAARAGIHRGDQLELRRERALPRGARDVDDAGLERLAQRLEHAAVPLRQFVEEQHAVMRERDFAGARIAAAADQRDAARRVMRRAERPLAPALGRRSVRRSTRRRRLRALRLRRAAAAATAAAARASTCPCPAVR